VPEKRSDKASTFIGGLLLAVLSSAGIVVLYLGRHHKGPLQHVDLSGDVTQFYAGLGTGVLLGFVFMFWKPKSPAQPETQAKPEQQPYDPNRPS